MCFVCGKMHIFCSIGIFIYQIHKLQMFAQMNDAQNTFMQSEKNGMDTKEKQIINWWTAQIFVYPSISTYAHRSNNLYLFYFIFFFHFLRDPAPVTQAFFLGIVLFGRLCDLQILFQ